jgi:DNA-binding transcriptional ArsR family regulator
LKPADAEPVQEALPDQDVEDRAVARLAGDLSHPLRVGILRALGREPGSPTELATSMRTPLATISYHLRVLSDSDLVRLVEQRARRGAIEHVYCLTPGGDAILRLIPNLAAVRLSATADQSSKARATDRCRPILRADACL